jgi:hypothetical protein
MAIFNSYVKLPEGRFYTKGTVNTIDRLAVRGENYGKLMSNLCLPCNHPKWPTQSSEMHQVIAKYRIFGTVLLTDQQAPRTTKLGI